jgi:predicted nucleic acid-binding protein
MTLSRIPGGCTVFVDANVLIYARRHASQDCVRFLERCAAGEVNGVISTLVLAEFCHRRMMQEAQAGGLAASNPAKALAQKPEIVRKLTVYADDVRRLVDGELVVEPVRAEDFLVAVELQREFALLTNDSLNLAVARRLTIADLATADANFDQVHGLRIHRPGDIPLPRG